MSFDLKMPCFLVEGALQGAVFIIDHADCSIAELSFYFTMTGLQEVRYSDVVFPGDAAVTIDKIVPRMELFLVYKSPAVEDDTVSVTISILKANGRETRRAETFETPPKEKMGIRLVNQTERFQQFQMLNPFPVAFSFRLGERNRVMQPNSNYSFLREASPDPLTLTLVEDGWEEFPVTIVATSFHTNTLIVELRWDEGDWVAGDAKFVEANPPSFAVENRDWIVVSQDPTGIRHLFIPKRPGVLGLPAFQVGQQACPTNPKTARVFACDCPPFVPL
jgi:hypothetical protein